MLLAALDELHADGPEESAAVIRGVLSGTEGPALRVVLANAAAALLAAEQVTTLAEGVERAAAAVADGRAAAVLDGLVRESGLTRRSAEMARKVILVTDPGIDGAFAGALALYAPELEVVGLAATAGNVPAEQATRNVHILVEQLDPPRWPRLGAALPVEYDVDGSALHGANGLGGVEFPCVQLHHTHPSDKLISDLRKNVSKRGRRSRTGAGDGVRAGPWTATRSYAGSWSGSLWWAAPGARPAT